MHKHIAEIASLIIQLLSLPLDFFLFPSFFFCIEFGFLLLFLLEERLFSEIKLFPSDLNTSNKGASLFSFWHSSDIIPFKSSNLFSVNVSVESAITLNIISFFVKVPVLSEIERFLGIVPGISVSLFINAEKYNLETSRFTLNDIGIIEQNRTMYFITLKKNLLLNPLALEIIKAIMSVITKRYILSLLISWSNIPTFNLGVLKFILALVSLPV